MSKHYVGDPVAWALVKPFDRDTVVEVSRGGATVKHWHDADPSLIRPLVFGDEDRPTPPTRNISPEAASHDE